MAEIPDWQYIEFLVWYFGAEKVHYVPRDVVNIFRVPLLREYHDESIPEFETEEIVIKTFLVKERSGKNMFFRVGFSDRIKLLVIEK